jgi:hypothetical protein
LSPTKAGDVKEPPRWLVAIADKETVALFAGLGTAFVSLLTALSAVALFLFYKPKAGGTVTVLKQPEAANAQEAADGGTSQSSG